MTETTRKAIRALLAADDTVQERTALEIEKIMIGNKAVAKDTPVTRAEAARLLGVSKVTVSKWVREGAIKKYSVGDRRAFGYSLNSINEILSGRGAA